MKAGSGNVAAQRAAAVTSLARLARETALRQEGVAKMRIRLAERLSTRKTPGVEACVGNDGWLRMEIRIVAREKAGLVQIGWRVQEAVIAAVRESSGPPVGPVNVHVA